MQFKVPQFLEIEDKIFGPFTFKEFVYLAGGGGICFVLYKVLGLIYGAIPILIIAGFAGMLTFYRPNNKPFINMLESGFKYFSQNKLYIWKRRQVKVGSKESVEKTENITSRNEVRLSGGKLRDLAWSLDVLDLNKHVGDSEF